MSNAVGDGRLERFARVRAAMRTEGVEVLLLSLGADLPWLSGYEAMPLERPTVLVVPAEHDAVLEGVPELEAARVKERPELFSLRPWRDGEDALDVVVGLVGAATQLRVSDRAWATLLLELQRRLPRAVFGAASSVTGSLRAVKDAAEVVALAAAGASADRVATALLDGEIALLGRTEFDVSAEIARRLLAEGHAQVNFSIVGSGPNAASPHHEASARVIGAGETVVCDFGGAFRLNGDVGYCSDTTRTVVTGEPSAELRQLYDVLEAAQAAAVEAVAPGVACEEIDRAGREIIAAAGYGERFIHRIGHGIGLEEHEDPYMVKGNATPLQQGHAFSVEPGIYLPGVMGARIEDIVVVGSDGAISLNLTDHGLHVVEA